MLGTDRGRAPCPATYHYVFQSISVEDLERALGALVASSSLGQIAIDGKTLHGGRHGTNPGVHILAALSTRLQAVVGSLAVPPDSGEVVEAFRLLKTLPLDGAIITGDAAFTHRPLAAEIHDGGDYFLLVKGNQPELEAELMHAFGDDSPLETGPARPGA